MIRGRHFEPIKEDEGNVSGSKIHFEMLCNANAYRMFKTRFNIRFNVQELQEL